MPEETRTGAGEQAPEVPAEEETYAVIGPEEAGFAPSILVRAEFGTQYSSVEALAEAEISAMRKEEGITELDRDDIFLANQFPASGVLYRLEMQGVELFQRRLYTIFEDVAYTLMLTFKDPGGEGKHAAGEALLEDFDPPNQIVWE